MSSQSIILFDGVCNLCNWWVNFVIRHDPSGRFKFASLQSETGQKLLNHYILTKNNLSSFIYIEDGKAYTRSTAACKVAGKLNGLPRLPYGLIIVPAFIRDLVYKLIANKRYKWFGKRDECMIPDPSIKERFLN